jgi:hypothetical protein
VRRLWAALAGLAVLELRRHRFTVHAVPTKNEEKKRRREGKREVID